MIFVSAGKVRLIIPFSYAQITSLFFQPAFSSVQRSTCSVPYSNKGFSNLAPLVQEVDELADSIRCLVYGTNQPPPPQLSNDQPPSVQSTAHNPCSIALSGDARHTNWKGLMASPGIGQTGCMRDVKHGNFISNCSILSHQHLGSVPICSQPAFTCR